MSVVFHQSAGKMILKGLVATLVFSLTWMKSATGATSYSNVYVQSGPSLASVYGPAGLSGAQLAPLAATPVMSNLLPPCVSPCVIPNQRIAALAPVATSSANFVSYKSPISVPVVVAPANNDAANYGYSYVVYDEDTGDQKAQKELSNGGVVRGQYSLVQPDGYIREVQYTADDLRGFNAVVKNFLPKYTLNTVSEEKASTPCPQVKNEPLKESLESKSLEEAHDLEPEAHGGERHEAKPKTEKHAKSAEPNRAITYGEPQKPKEEGHREAEPHSKPEAKGETEGHEVSSETVEALVEPVKHEVPKKKAKPENHEEVHVEAGGVEKKKEKPRAEQRPEPQPDALVSYNDVIKCIQAAIKGVNAPTASPLTYIVLNKPC